MKTNIKYASLAFLLVLTILFSSILISAGDVPSEVTDKYTTYKWDNFSNVLIGAEKSYHCYIKPDSINDGNKVCNTYLILWNKNGSSVNINLNESNFAITEEYDVSYKYTDDVSDLVTEITAKTYTEDNSSGYTTREYDKENLTTFDFGNFVNLDGSDYNLSDDEIIVIRQTFEIPEYEGINYNSTYDYAGFHMEIDPTVSACGTLSSPGEYTLDQNISTSGTDCFEITSDDVILDGAGYTIDGNNDAYKAVKAVGRNNVTIKNLEIYDFSKSIYFENTNTSVIDNVWVHNCGSGGDSFTLHLVHSSYNLLNNLNVSYNLGDRAIVVGGNCDNNNFTNIIANSNGDKGMYLYASDASNWPNDNRIQNVQTNYNGVDGIAIAPGNGTTLINVTANNQSEGILLLTSSQTSLNDITVNNNDIGIVLWSYSDNNNFTDVTAWNNDVGINYIYDPSNNNIFDNVTISASSIWDLDIENSLDKLLIKDSSILTYYLSSISNVSFEDSTDGRIDFLANIDGNGINLFGFNTSSIQISNNFVYDIASAGLDMPANITLKSVPVLINPKILRDGVECNESTTPACYNFTALNAGTVKFNVTGWSNYTIGGEPSPESETVKDEIIGSFSTLAIWVGLLALVVMAGFIFLLVRKEDGIGVGLDGDMMIRSVSIIVGALILVGLAILIIENLMS